MQDWLPELVNMSKSNLSKDGKDGLLASGQIELVLYPALETTLVQAHQTRVQEGWDCSLGLSTLIN